MDEHNLEEIVGDSVTVGKVLSSRLHFGVVVSRNQFFILGGYDEYKHKYLKTVEVVTVGT